MNNLNQDETVEDRPLSSRGGNLPGEYRLYALPRGRTLIIHGIAWQGRGATV